MITRPRTESYFEEGDLAILDKAKNLGILAIASNSTTFSSHLQLALADVSYIPVWRAAVRALLDYQGDRHSYLSWKIAKQQAFDILEQRDLVAELFDDVEDELRSRTIDVRNGILQKIHLLERFTAIYDAQPVPTTMEHRPEPEPHYQLHPLEVGNKKKRIVEASLLSGRWLCIAPCLFSCYGISGEGRGLADRHLKGMSTNREMAQ